MPVQMRPASDLPVLHQRRCLLVVAAPGYGKTSALRAWLPTADTVWTEFTSVGELALSHADERPARSGRRWRGGTGAAS